MNSNEDSSKKESNDKSFMEAFPSLLSAIATASTKAEIKSQSSSNVYTVLGSKGGSNVGVSVALTAAPNPKIGNAFELVIRFLEQPPAGVFTSQFENSGEARMYLSEGIAVNVYMLFKTSFLISSAETSGFEMRQSIEIAKPDVVDYIWQILQTNDVAINCKSKEEMGFHLFQRYEDLPVKSACLWEAIDLTSTPTL